MRIKLKQILAPDYKVYDYFKSKFDDRLEAFGSGLMEEEMVKLRKVNDKVIKKCEKKTHLKYSDERKKLIFNFIVIKVISPRRTTRRSQEQTDGMARLTWWDIW